MEFDEELARDRGRDAFDTLREENARLCQRVEELEQTDKWHANERYKAETKLANSEEDRKWMEAQIRDLEAKLAKVVEALEKIATFDTHVGCCQIARAALAVAKGEK